MELDWGKRPPTSFVDPTTFFLNQPSKLKLRTCPRFGMRTGLNSCYLHPPLLSHHLFQPPMASQPGVTAQISIPSPFANWAQNSSGGEEVVPSKGKLLSLLLKLIVGNDRPGGLR